MIRRQRHVHYHVGGDLVPAERATVSVRDRGFRYGDGVFETLRVYGGEVFEWAAHEERLRASAAELGFADAVPEDLALRVAETLDANDLEEAYVRLSVTRGAGGGRLTPNPDPDPTVVVVIVEELPRGGLGGTSPWTGAATLQTVTTRATPDAAVPSGTKTHNYLDGVLARLELRRAASEEYRADEALVRDAEGHVAEGATSNVFLVEEGVVKTPSAEGPLLPGITRSVVLDIAEAEGVPVETGTYTPDDLRGADEAFLTNSTWELRPVDRVDGVAVGDEGASTDGSRNDAATSGGPLTRLLARLFDERVERRHYRGTRATDHE